MLKTATSADSRRLIEIGESTLKSTDEHWHEIPVERLPLARFGQGLNGLFVAVGYLMLNDVRKARDWFAITAQFFLEANRQADTVIAEKRALECALFSGDNEYRLRVAQKIAARTTRVKPMEYPYAMFLKYMILQQHAEAAAFADKAAWLSPATMKKRGGYGSLRSACQALTARQPRELTTALEALLREHKMKASHSGSKLPDGMLCFPGAALLLLAREQGVSVNVTSPFIPEALLE